MPWLLSIVLLWTQGCMYHYLFELHFCPDICPEVGLQDHMAALVSLLRNLHTVLHMAMPTYVPTNTTGGLLFLIVIFSVEKIAGGYRNFILICFLQATLSWFVCSLTSSHLNSGWKGWVFQIWSCWFASDGVQGTQPQKRALGNAEHLKLKESEKKTEAGGSLWPSPLLPLSLKWVIWNLPCEECLPRTRRKKTFLSIAKELGARNVRTQTLWNSSLSMTSLPFAIQAQTPLSCHFFTILHFFT